MNVRVGTEKTLDNTCENVTLSNQFLKIKVKYVIWDRSDRKNINIFLKNVNNSWR